MSSFFRYSFKFLVFTVLVLQLQACTGESYVTAAEPTAQKSEASKEEQSEEKSKSLKETDEEHEYKEMEVGMNLKEVFSKVVGQNEDGKMQNLADLLSSSKRNVIALVKPGCIYCESWLALMKANNHKIDANIIYLLDAKHAEFEEFIEKVERSKTAKGKWFYDLHNSLHDEFGVNSFPRFLVLDKKGVLMHEQKGLVLPENRESLRDMEMPLILQKLSKETITWLEQY